MRAVWALLLLFVIGLFADGAARAHPGDLNRCVGTDGRSIYTDQSCDQIGASVKPQAPEISGSNKAAAKTVHVHVRDCAKTLEALRDGMHAAVVSGDVNHLAAFYQWTGMGNASASGILDRLQSIVGRPVVAVTLLRSHPVPEPEGGDGSAPEKAMAAEQAGGIAIEQMRSPSDPTPVRTVFAVTAYMGCWWVRF